MSNIVLDIVAGWFLFSAPIGMVLGKVVGRRELELPPPVEQYYRVPVRR